MSTAAWTCSDGLGGPFGISSEQLLSTVRQGQQLSVDAAQAWVKAVSEFPGADLSKVPGVPGVRTFTFDVAADLFNARRGVVLQLTNVLVPERSSDPRPAHATM